MIYPEIITLLTLVLRVGIFGTPPNVPYEAYQQKYYDPFWGDVWALGMIYCQMRFPLAPWNMALQTPSTFAMFSPSVSHGSSPIDSRYVQTTVEMLLRNLPAQARPVIGGMLQLDAQDRINLKEALSDDWIRSLHNCESQLHSISEFLVELET